jgi:hypothetical protein
VATYFVDITHLMWDDFIPVDFVLVIHIPVEHNRVGIGEWLSATVRSCWQAGRPA